MSISLRLFLVLISSVFSVIVLMKTVKKRIVEKESILWILLIVPVIVLSVFPNIIIRLSDWIGVEYAPTLFFLVCIVFLVSLAFRQSMKISMLEHKVKDLAQYVSLHNHELAERQQPTTVNAPMDGSGPDMDGQPGEDKQDRENP